MTFLYEFENKFNAYIPEMRKLIKNIPIYYQNKYVDLLFNLYSNIYELCETHDMDELNLDTLKIDTDKVIDDYSNYLKYLDLIEIENINYSNHFNGLKNKYDNILKIHEDYIIAD